MGASLTSAETLSLGYTEGKNYTGAPMGIGAGDNMWIDMAIKIPGSTIRTLAGAQITGVNGSCSSIADVETFHIWLRQDLEGENLAEFTLVPNQLNNVKKGINKLKFKTPWEIPADFEGDLYIGFGYKYSSGNARGLAVSTNPIPGGFYMLRADSLWYDYSHLGSACIEAIVEGENLPKINPQLSRIDLPEFYIKTREEYTPTFVIHNFGTETLASIDVTAQFDGCEAITQQVAVDTESGMMETFTLSFNPQDAPINATNATFTIAPTTGEDADTENNSLAGTFTTAPQEYQHRVLSEEFTTEMCGSCPAITKWTHEELQKEEFKDIIMVCHHAGYKTDFLTTAWDSEYTKLYGGGTFAPGFAADRAILSQNDIVFFPTPNEALTDWWKVRLAEPALVSVDLKVTQSENAENEIVVEVWGEKCIETIAENPSVTVWLIEDGIPAVEQANGGKDYIHNHVNRAVQSENYWGEPVTFEGDKYNYSCTFTLDEGWVKENMYVVAFIGENGSNYKKHLVRNANRVKLTDQIDAVESIEADKEVINTEYFDITGQRVINPDKGIYIIRKSYSDGSVDTQKSIIRRNR